MKPQQPVTLFKKSLLWAVLFLLSYPTFSQLVLNEVCAANYTQWTLSGENEDWIELYNNNGAAVNLGGYWLSDNPSDLQKWEFPATAIIPANGFLTVLASGRGDYEPNFLGQINASFKLTQTGGESVILSDPSGTQLDAFSFSVNGSNQANQSWGRSTNGTGNWVIFTTPTPNASNTGATATAYAAKPQFSAQAGYYSNAINLSITTTDASAQIRYTLDGSEPTAASTLYTSPITINLTTVVRAVAFSSTAGVLPSFVETNTYFFGADQHQVMIFSCSGDDVGDGNWFGDEAMHIEMFTPQGVFLAEAAGDSNEHGNDSNAYDQRGFDYVTRDAMGYDDEIEQPIFHESDRQGFQRLIFKAAANDNYPAEGDGAHVRDAYVAQLSIEGKLHLDERTTESCIVYLNGVYWGVYEAREKVDDADFTDFYYDQEEQYLDYLKTWGGTWADYGTITDWNTLVNFITTNDMSVQANYDYAVSQYNTMSLIDYFVLNSYVVATDWLNWNTSWWRGRNPLGDGRRWRYALWDMDATFGHYINYTGVPSQDPTADPCQIENMGDVGGQGHVPVLNALFDNESFRADYIQRYAALSNTIFSCDRMIQILDSMVNVIQPEMTRHCQRWGGNVATWQNNVQAIRDFIQLRCSDEIVGGIEDCYDVTAYTVTVQIDGVGSLEIEEIDVNNDNAPWSGTFFGGLAIDIEADGDQCGTFAGWEIISGDGTIADPTNPITTLSISSDVTIVARFQESTGFAHVVLGSNLPDAGVITLDGTPISGQYQDNDFALGGVHNLEVTTNEWFTFTGWRTNVVDLTPDDESTTVSFTACTADSIIAMFDAIPHARLTVNISPAGAGAITMDGDALTLEWSDVILADQLYNFQTTPSDVWSEFSHWEINHHTLTPDEFSTAIGLHLMEDDTLVAVYNIIPHASLTVMVEPAESGTAQFASLYSTNREVTAELETGVVIPLRATAEEFYDFKGWYTKQGTLVFPNPSLAISQLILNYSDTLVAVFEKQPFAVYVPNSFSPNNDGVNDVWVPVGNAIDVTEYSLKIFDRWGTKVFETTDPTAYWQGNISGGAYYTQNEVYNYVLRIKSVFENDPREFSGTVLVFR